MGRAWNIFLRSCRVTWESIGAALLRGDLMLCKVWVWLKESGLEPSAACLNAYVTAWNVSVMALSASLLPSAAFQA